MPWFAAGSNLVAGAQTVTLSVPANAAWYLLDLRANGDPASVVSTTNQIGVGEVIAAAGQSLATDFWDTNASGDTATLASLGVVPSAYSAASPPGTATPRCRPGRSRRMAARTAPPSPPSSCAVSSPQPG